MRNRGSRACAIDACFALLLGGCALPPCLGAPAAKVTHAAPAPLRQTGPGSFAWQGPHEEASPANLGAIANTGFIIGSNCVAVIDTGGSLAAGKRLRAAVRRVTSLPVCYVINTHAHPDHILGNAAFSEDRPVLVAHRNFPQALAARAERFLGAAARALGPAAAGTTAVAPTRLVAQRASLDLGGRVLRLRAWGVAHTDNDLTVYDEATRTLWCGDLLFADRIPALDGSLAGWLAALDELDAMAIGRAIPGHGALGRPWAQVLGAQRRYLAALQAETRQAVRSGHTMAEAQGRVGASERGRWLLFRDYHRRNVAAAYAEIEWE